MNLLDLVGLTPLMRLTEGSPKVKVALLDGPVSVENVDLGGANIRGAPGLRSAGCLRLDSSACAHGTFVAGVLCARRGSAAPAICPGCALLVHPIFSEAASPRHAELPSATPEEVGAAIAEGVEAGAWVVNLSAAFDRPSLKEERRLEEALDLAARRGAIIVAAAGNQGTLGGSAITRHPWVLPVAGCDAHGRPAGRTNLGASVGRRGLMAPGEGVRSMGVDGVATTAGGTSVAAPFVSGAVALLWSLFPAAPAGEVRAAVTRGRRVRRGSVVPPLMDAWATYRTLANTYGRREGGEPGTLEHPGEGFAGARSRGHNERAQGAGR